MEEDRYTRITLRIPRDLHLQLEQQAMQTSKSLNAEIVSRVQQTFEPSMHVNFLEQRVKSLEVVAEAYRASAESAYTATIVMMERLEQLASELPKDHRLAQQTLALIELMRSKVAANPPINQDRFSSEDLTHSVVLAPRAATAGKK